MKPEGFDVRVGMLRALAGKGALKCFGPSGLSSMQAAVFLAIRQYYELDGGSYKLPSPTAIARDLGITESGARGAIRRIERSGVLVPEVMQSKELWDWPPNRRWYRMTVADIRRIRRATQDVGDWGTVLAYLHVLSFLHGEKPRRFTQKQLAEQMGRSLIVVKHQLAALQKANLLDWQKKRGYVLTTPLKLVEEVVAVAGVPMTVREEAPAPPTRPAGRPEAVPPAPAPSRSDPNDWTAGLPFFGEDRSILKCLRIHGCDTPEKVEGYNTYLRDVEAFIDRQFESLPFPEMDAWLGNLSLEMNGERRLHERMRLAKDRRLDAIRRLQDLPAAEPRSAAERARNEGLPRILKVSGSQETVDALDQFYTKEEAAKALGRELGKNEVAFFITREWAMGDMVKPYRILKLSVREEDQTASTAAERTDGLPKPAGKPETLTGDQRGRWHAYVMDCWRKEHLRTIGREAASVPSDAKRAKELVSAFEQTGYAIGEPTGNPAKAVSTFIAFAADKAREAGLTMFRLGLIVLNFDPLRLEGKLVYTKVR